MRNLAGWRPLCVDASGPKGDSRPPSYPRDFPAFGFHFREPPVFRRRPMPAQSHTSEDVALSLTLAIVTSSPAPLLLLDGELTVIAASTSFCDVFGVKAAELAGQPLYALDAGEWDSPQLRSLMTATLSDEGTLDARDIDLKRPRRPIRHLIVQTRRLVYLDLEQTRILVAVSDVTKARADAKLKEDVARENSVLLQEVRHRVANSLQIIASVLLQNARKTTSDETRGHLKDAHHRVMSVAALERLLSTSEDGDVEVQGYFTSLCESISASMIGEVDQISLTVEGGEGVVDARVSVSLGLIVTELVINALKHAFPDGRPGKITVDYNFHGPNWILCVRDDGVGMPLNAPVRTGLGTSIVRALAGQLNASVDVTPEQPGTQVSIKHTQIALVEDEPETASEPLAAAHPTSSAING
jgi:PAS domain S-box-containing protein